MRAIYGVVNEDGKKVRRVIVLEDRACIICGSMFSPQKQQSDTCSLACSKKKDYLNNRDKRESRRQDWYNENREVIRAKRKDRYWSDPEKYKEKTREYNRIHKKEKNAKDQLYKDKTRHGDLRSVLIELYGMICQRCGTECESFDLVAHHISGDPTDHANQTLLCRSCHAKIHNLGDYKNKDIAKEEIVNALEQYPLLEDACEYLGISRAFLRKKRIEYGLPLRKKPNGSSKT